MYRNTLYTLIFVLLFFSWSLSEILGPVRWSKRREDEANHDRGSLVSSVIVGITSLVLSFLFPVLLPWSLIPWQPEVFFIGISLIIVGVIWRWYAIRTLGSLFTAQVFVQKNQKVVQHGPYRWVRHPSYTGFLFIILGFGLMIGSWLSVLLLSLSLGASLLYRISVEEQELLRYCPEYKAYRQKTKRLLPFLY